MLSILTFLISLPIIHNLNYKDVEMKKQRKETTDHIYNIKNNLPINIVWRQYTLQKDDIGKRGSAISNIAAKTMADQETIASVNQLVSQYEATPGDVWFIPNARGIAKYGDPTQLSLQYKIAKEYISKVPNSNNLWFIPGVKLTTVEKKINDSYFKLTIFMRPVQGIIASTFGIRNDPFSQKQKFHKGIDISCPIGSKVKASADGEIIFTGWLNGYGNTIIMKHANDYQTLYGHLSTITINQNRSVKQGELIAMSGNTGRTTGPHLHFEVKRRVKTLTQL